MTYKRAVNIISMLGLILTAGFMYWAWKQGILTSQENMQKFIMGFGTAAGIIFVLIQIIQVIIPVIPGGVSCVAGVIVFGAGMGFVYNYVGICIGSILVFLIAKRYGRALMVKMFDKKLIDKYESWTEKNGRFTKLFALAIFLPVAPDDFLCYLAGTTRMKLKTFTAVILLGKPLSIAAYSMGLNLILQTMLKGVALC
ncbi:MAG: VTT domain-containing protein [Lachnobacterium sp.]|nr:VTT domain-containing protein [Lachnobacterium sp.]MDD6633111.1 VTT domain-containing protein [Lachnobacterium sp.]MDY2911899.1 VTT domain-containing protein [Agathobacter sp.]